MERGSRAPCPHVCGWVGVEFLSVENGLSPNHPHKLLHRRQQQGYQFYYLHKKHPQTSTTKVPPSSPSSTPHHSRHCRHSLPLDRGVLCQRVSETHVNAAVRRLYRGLFEVPRLAPSQVQRTPPSGLAFGMEDVRTVRFIVWRALCLETPPLSRETGRNVCST